MIQILRWCNPEELIDCQWGTLKIKDWMRKFKTNILNDKENKRVAQIKERTVKLNGKMKKQIALFANDIA